MKFYGQVGFWEADVETAPGVWRPGCITEKTYSGEVYRNTRKFQATENSQNGEFTISNQISILSDLYMQQNWPSIKYIIWKGTKWKVANIDINFPRITLDIGGVYNG
jgi:hypothetical protein